MSTYNYQPISPQQIRLLTIRPGNHDDPLTGYLTTRKFAPEEGENPQYEALSYVWGDSRDSELITIRKQPVDTTQTNGTDDIDQKTLEIRQNLATAIRHLRFTDRARTIWCDAICINQSDLEERAEHVASMGNVFRAAWRVVVWLGPQADDSHIALDALMRLFSHVDTSRIEHDLHQRSLRVKNNIFTRPEYWKASNPLTVDEWRAVAKLVSRPWFGRLWIRQEIAVGNLEAIVVVGSQQMLWLNFIVAVTYINNLAQSRYANAFDAFTASRFFEDSTRVRYLWHHRKEQAMTSIINLTVHCHCSDNRDRVYAVLSLAPSALRQAITPDYTKNTKQVYKSLVIEWLKLYGNLDILIHCNLATKPSWVPDLHRLGDARFTAHLAASQFHGKFTLLEDDSIELWGMECDEIASCIAEFPEGLTAENMIETLTASLKRILGDQSDQWDMIKLESIITVLLQGATRELVKSPSSPITANVISTFKNWMRDKEDRDDDLRVANFVTRILKHRLTGKALYMSKNGFFTIGTMNCHPGDRVFALLGCTTSMILRPTSSDFDDDYHVIGPAYHPKSTLGETFLGPLPKGWTAVRDFTVTPNKTVFYNEIGLPHAADPRLEGIDLPSGWRESKDENGVRCWRSEDGKSSKRYYDPRLTLEELKRRKVPVDAIVLV